MSKKDYQAIARAIYGTRRNVAETKTENLTPRELAKWAVGNVASRVADVLASDPRFNRALFLEACETGRCKGMLA